MEEWPRRPRNRFQTRKPDPWNHSSSQRVLNLEPSSPHPCPGDRRQQDGSSPPRTCPDPTTLLHRQPLVYIQQAAVPYTPSLANQTILPAPTALCRGDQGPATGLLTCAVVGGIPKNTITHLDLDTVTQGWAQRWRQWFLGAWLFEKFCQCPMEKGRCGRDL